MPTLKNILAFLTYGQMRKAHSLEATAYHFHIFSNESPCNHEIEFLTFIGVE